MFSEICVWTLISFCLVTTQKIKDEDRPYEFGFTIDGQQHRHEKKDVNGIIQGEFGFITADGVYHVTVYATDENGNFKILSMRNIRISAPLDGSPLPRGQTITSLSNVNTNSNKQTDRQETVVMTSKEDQRPVQTAQPESTTVRKPYIFTTQPTIKPACAGCGYVTTAKPKPGEKFPFQTPAFQNSRQASNVGLQNSKPLLDNIGVGPVGNNVPNNAVGKKVTALQAPETLNPSTSSELRSVNSDVTNSGVQNTQNEFENRNSGNVLTNQPSKPIVLEEYVRQNKQQQSILSTTGSNLKLQNPGQHIQNVPLAKGPLLQEKVTNFGLQNTRQQLQNPNLENVVTNQASKPIVAQQNIGQNMQQQNILQNAGYTPKLQNPLEQGPNVPAKGPLSQVSVADGVIHVPGNPDIPIQDKYPGMVDGLPKGIKEKDITDLLYKFNYTVGFHGHYEKGYKNGAKIGGYFVTGRDGLSRIVTYVADENGFRPKVKFVRLDLISDEVPKEGSEKTFGLKNFEFVWYPVS